MVFKKSKLIIAAVIFFCCVSIGLTVNAQGLKNAFSNANTVADAGGYKTEGVSAESMAAKLISVILSTLGVVFLILMIYGGYLWMTASGDEQKVTKAKNLITAAIIGVIIIVSAYTITFFVIDNVTSGVLK